MEWGLEWFLFNLFVYAGPARNDVEFHNVIGDSIGKGRADETEGYSVCCFL